MKQRVGIVGLVVACGLASSLAGCGRSSPSEQALRTARRSMATLHAGVTPAPTETRRATQQQVVSDLRGATDQLKGGSQVAALILLSEAQAGLAQIEAERATALASKFGSGVLELRAAGRLYASQAALAKALSTFEGETEISGLESQATSIEGELASAMQEKRTLEGRLASLEGKVGELLGKAKALRAEESQVRADVAGMPASSRAGSLERARLISRQADALEKEAAQTRAAAGQVGPLVAVAGMEIERLTTQKSLLVTAVKEIRARKSAREEQAAAARKAADDAASQTAQALASLEALRTGEMRSSFDGATQGYLAAIGSAKRATSVAGVSDNRTTGQIAVAGLQQSLGGLEETRARALDQYEATLAWLNGVDTEMPQKDGVSAALSSVREEESAAQAAAGEAYEAARSSLQSAGARGDLAERVEKLLALLPATAAAPAPAPAPETPVEPSQDEAAPEPQPAPEASEPSAAN